MAGRFDEALGLVGRLVRDNWRRTAVTFATGMGVLALMHIPYVQQSFVGAADRQMLDGAFHIRQDVYTGLADPALFIDIDDRTLNGEPSDANLSKPAPSATTPRLTVAALLNFVRGAPPVDRPRLTVLDVDLATPTPGDEAGVASVRQALTDWAADPANPPLLMAREAFPPAAMGVPGNAKVLPPTAYDDIVGRAPNLFWVSVKMLADKDGQIREYLPYECVRTTHGVEVLYNAALLGYGFLKGGPPPEGRESRQWILDAPKVCKAQPDYQFTHGGTINYHISLGRTAASNAWPDLPPGWEGDKQCGSGDRSMFRVLSASDVIAAGPDASRGILCRRIIGIGGTNTAGGDFRPTALSEMSGTVILLNAIRGMQLTDGGLRQLGFALQGAVVFAVCMVYAAAFSITRKARDHFQRLKTIGAASVLNRFQLILLNPVVLNSAIALAVQWLGVGGLILSLRFGYWGFLSAPSMAAAIVETVQEFRRDD